jgi:NAD+--dinitrogen-reductase ADP-D-ribosyltransferase
VADLPSDPDVPRLPASACLPINRCNLSAGLLGSLTFQRHPAPLVLDGVGQLHTCLFDVLDQCPLPGLRATRFREYMALSFLLDHPEEAGLNPQKGPGRSRADYLKLLRGWLFDPDGREAAVLKGWVESRFGLLPRSHKGPLEDYSGESYYAYLQDRSAGLYNTNALEAQLDLLYSFCQYELALRFPNRTHLQLYRGVNHLTSHDILAHPTRDTYIVLLNNLCSFTANRERADEFGDQVIRCDLPLVKLLYFPGLLPELLQGEEEYLVIGGLYEVHLEPV